MMPFSPFESPEIASPQTNVHAVLAQEILFSYQYAFPVFTYDKQGHLTKIAHLPIFDSILLDLHRDHVTNPISMSIIFTYNSIIYLNDRAAVLTLLENRNNGLYWKPTS